MEDRGTPLSRVTAAFSGLFEPVDPSGPPIVAPPAVKEWAWNTSVLTIFTSAFMALQEYQRQQVDPLRVPQHLPPALHDMFLRNQQSARVAKVANKALWSGCYAMAFGSMFYGSEAICGIARDQPADKWNTAVGGIAAGTLAGGMLPGPPLFKLTRAGLGCLAGGVAGLTVGYLTHDLLPSLQEDDRKTG